MTIRNLSGAVTASGAESYSGDACKVIVLQRKALQFGDSIFTNVNARLAAGKYKKAGHARR
eukprot:scaffold216065_cov25-Prasinocladus_malaysianus.AAC.1